MDELEFMNPLGVYAIAFVATAWAGSASTPPSPCSR